MRFFFREKRAATSTTLRIVLRFTHDENYAIRNDREGSVDR